MAYIETLTQTTKFWGFVTQISLYTTKVTNTFTSTLTNISTSTGTDILTSISTDIYNNTILTSLPVPVAGQLPLTGTIIGVVSRLVDIVSRANNN